MDTEQGNTETPETEVAEALLDTDMSDLRAQLLGNKAEIVEQEPETETTEEVQETETKKEVAEVKEEIKEEPEKQEEKNPFGLKFGKNKGKKQPEYIIETPEHVLEVVSKRFGQDLKDIKEMPKFFESAKKWRDDSQKLPDIAAKQKQYEDLLTGLPEDLLTAIDLHYKGQNYKEAVTGAKRLDYNQPFEKLQLKDVINHYFPDKFSEDEFDTEELSRDMEIAASAAKTKFESEKQMFNMQRSTYEENAKKQLAVINQSIDSSVTHLTKSFPDVDNSEIEKIKETLSGGQNAILQEFYNQDGTVKETAAKALMLAKYGEETINRFMKIAEHEAETRVNEELLTRGNETRKPKSGNGQTETLSKEAQAKLEEYIRRMNLEKTTF